MTRAVSAVSGVAVVALASCCALSACGDAASEGAGSAQPSVASSAVTTGRPSSPDVGQVSAKRQVTAKRQARARCRHHKPATIRARYLPVARRRGTDPELLRLASDPPARLRRPASAAGLAAAVYAATRPVAERPVAFAVCRVELRRVTAKKGSL
jgi:hypothetical protein